MSIVHIPFFGIDIPASSQCIRFGTKSSRMEVDDHVELGEKLTPMGLSPHQEFHGGKVFEVLMISDDINWVSRTFQIVMPTLECLMNCKEPLIMGVIVQFWWGQCP